jgi:hypothetical protein
VNTENLPTRKNLRALGRYFWPLHFVWWTITQWWTRPKAAHLKAPDVDAALAALPEIPRFSYKRDKPFDFMRHPLAIGLRTIAGRAVGDCDDFAAWRAAWLLSGDPIVGHYPNDRPDVYIAILKFKRAAHAVTIWNDEHGNWLWADYGAPFTAPYSVAPPVFAIGRRVAVAHNRTPLIGVAYARVTLRDNGALRFGRVKVGAV